MLEESGILLGQGVICVPFLIPSKWFYIRIKWNPFQYKQFVSSFYGFFFFCDLVMIRIVYLFDFVV